VNAAYLIRTGLSAAKLRAVAADMTHNRAVKTMPEEMNPSSGVYKLIDAIYAAFPPRI
jgi:hypothetical protein